MLLMQTGKTHKGNALAIRRPPWADVAISARRQIANAVAAEIVNGDHSFIAIYDFGRDSVRYLAPSADRDVSPRWSPDGKRIAFMRLPGLHEKHPLIPVPVTPWSIWVSDTATGTGKEIWHTGNTPNHS